MTDILRNVKVFYFVFRYGIHQTYLTVNGYLFSEVLKIATYKEKSPF